MALMKITCKALRVVMVVALVAAAAQLAGCGGGGSDYEDACVKNPSICYGKTRVILKGTVVVPDNISLARAGTGKRSANLDPDDLQNFTGAVVTIGHMKYSSYDGDTYIDPDIITSATVGSNGSYTLYNVPTDDNMVLTASYTTTGGVTYVVRNIITVDDDYAGGSFYATGTTVETTFAYEGLHEALLEYNKNSAGTGAVYFDAEDINTSDVSDMIELINSYLPWAITSGAVDISNVLKKDDMSLPAQFKNLKDVAPELTALVGQMGAPPGIAPYVVGFSPADGATGVAYNLTTFKLMFSESMNSSIDYNTPATLSASGFSITVRQSGTSNSLPINASNALDYGSFGWALTVLPNDTLTFTLRSNTALSGDGLNTLKANTEYEITAFNVPTNLKSASGLSLNTTKNMPGISGGNYGSFTTKP